MDPKKKSALTAALSSNPAEAGSGQSDQPTATKADTFSFPCLAEGNVSNVDDIAAGVERVDLSRRPTLAGSAPTAPRLSSTMTVSKEEAMDGIERYNAYIVLYDSTTNAVAPLY